MFAFFEQNNVQVVANLPIKDVQYAVIFFSKKEIDKLY